MGARTTALVAAVLGTLAVAAVLLGGARDEHRIRAAFDAAHNVVPGLQVRLAGRPVGTIRDARTDGGHALLELGITDERAWPLPAGTVARLRYGPTAGYVVRYVELRPGPVGAPPLPENALLPADRTETPVEVDDVLRVMDRRGRAAARGYLAAADGALGGQGDRLAATVGAAAESADAFAQVTDQLARSRTALATLVQTGASTSAALARRRPALQEAVSGFGRTYDELARREPALGATLRALPGTLSRARTTLARAVPTLTRLDRLTGDLAPAARELRATAPDLAATLRSLRTVTPAATTALAATRRAEPVISRLLATAPGFARGTTPVLRRLQPMLACVRPYTPEVAGVLSTWAGYAMHYDANGHFARAELQVSPSIYNDVPITPEQFVGLVPDTAYALPPAPGAGVDQPWYQPRCGAGPEATDPRNDPERRR